jgi:hypothetical protein
VTGYFKTDYSLLGNPHAFLWDGSATHDLNELIAPADPLRLCVTLESSNDINDLGQILAHGYDRCLSPQRVYTAPRAYVVSPVDTTPVPNVVGMTQAAATTAITNAGFVLGTVQQQASSTVASGYVISESPAAGTMAVSGSMVNLVVSSGGGGGGIGFTTLLPLLLLLRRRRYLERN